RLCLGTAEPGQGQPIGGGGPSGAAVIKQENAIVAQGPGEPVIAPGRARTRTARTALGEKRPRPGTARGRRGPRRHDPAREYGDPRAIRIGVIERHLEVVVGQYGAWLPEGGHAGHATRR